MLNETICWSPGLTLKDVELNTIRYAFKYYKENKTSTAKALGISIRTLDGKLIELRTMEKRAEWYALEKKREAEAYLYRARGQEVPQHLRDPIPPPPMDDEPSTAALSLPKRKAQHGVEETPSEYAVGS